MGFSTILLLTLSTGSSFDLDLFEVVSAAQRAQGESTMRGRLEARVVHEYIWKGTVACDVKANWDGNDLFFLFKISDPARAFAEFASMIMFFISLSLFAFGVRKLLFARICYH